MSAGNHPTTKYHILVLFSNVSRQPLNNKVSYPGVLQQCQQAITQQQQCIKTWCSLAMSAGNHPTKMYHILVFFSNVSRQSPNNKESYLRALATKLIRALFKLK
jgi:hypothetical protein